ncbi:MAG TPA: hypothetical protein ENH06_01835 [bacterium]|nr:hypothetical protein [bacterium]
MEKKKKIILVILIIVIILISLKFVLKNSETSKIIIITDKTEYNEGENLKLKIENQSGEVLCISSCYPYLFEKKEKEEWKYYKYKECQEQNLNQKCLDSNNVKAFEIPLSLIGDGGHRIAVPACIGCSFNQEFQEKERFYSNEFKIK